MKRYFKVYATKSAKQRVLSSDEDEFDEEWWDFKDQHENDSDEEFSYAAEEQAYDVLEQLGIGEIEPSVQGGFGGIWIYDTDGQCLAENIDYQEYCSRISNLAYNASSLAEFKRSYKDYLESLIS